jgi:hypothetical protein
MAYCIISEILSARGDTASRPLLVIDDESDQASVDTRQQQFDDDDVPDPDYEPTRINGQIRKLLSAFSRSAYVGYTATPFANILIHDAAVANEYGDDLFPRSFIINLPAPSNYVGPDLVFGTDAGDGGASEEPFPAANEVRAASKTSRSPRGCNARRAAWSALVSLRRCERMAACHRGCVKTPVEL